MVITTKLAEKEEIGEEGGGGRDDGIGIITPGLLPPEEYKDQIPGQIQQKPLLQQDNRNTSDLPPAQTLEDESRRELHAQRHIGDEPSTVSRLVSRTHGDSEPGSVLQPSEGYDDVQHQSGLSERGEYDSHRLGNQDEEFERGYERAHGGETSTSTTKGMPGETLTDTTIPAINQPTDTGQHKEGDGADENGFSKSRTSLFGTHATERNGQGLKSTCRQLPK